MIEAAQGKHLAMVTVEDARTESCFGSSSMPSRRNSHSQNIRAEGLTILNPELHCAAVE